MIALCILAGAVVTNPASPDDGYFAGEVAGVSNLRHLNCNFNALNGGKSVNIDNLRNCFVTDKIYIGNASNSTFENVSADYLSNVSAYLLLLDRNATVNDSVVRSVIAGEDYNVTSQNTTIYLKDGLKTYFDLTDSILVVLPSFTGELTVIMKHSMFEAHNFAGKRLSFNEVVDSTIDIEAYAVYRYNFIAQLSSVNTTNIYINVTFGDAPTGTIRDCNVIQGDSNFDKVFMNITASILTRYELDFSVFEYLSGFSVFIDSTVLISSSLKQELSMIKSTTNLTNANFSFTIYFKDLNYYSADSYDVTIHYFDRNLSASAYDNCFYKFAASSTSGENINYTMNQIEGTSCFSKDDVTLTLQNAAMPDILFGFDSSNSSYGYFENGAKFGCLASQAINWNDLTCIDLDIGSSTQVNFTTLKIACFVCFGVFLLAVLVLGALAIYYCCRSRYSDYEFKKTAKEVSVKIPSDSMDQDLLSYNHAYTEEVLISQKPDTVQQLNLNDPYAKKNYGFRQISDIDDSSEDDDYMKLMNEYMKIQYETVKDVYKGEELFDNTNIFRYTTKNKGRDRLQKVTFDETISEVAAGGAQSNEPATEEDKGASRAEM